MQRYANLSGDSGVVEYELGRVSIAVKFQDGPTYLYTYASAGALHVEEMKKLAAAGRGLCTYISRNVRNSYESNRR